MKRCLALTNLLLLVFPLFAFADWQVTKPQAAIPREPFFEAGVRLPPRTIRAPAPSVYAGHAFPNQFAKLGQPASVFAVSISGSLKENIERIMGRYRWRVIWKAPFDYNFDGRITGSSLPNVIEKLVQPFPLQAIMYMSNRTLIIIPRFKTGK